MNKYISVLLIVAVASGVCLGQSPSFDTFMNPVIPGDHPDCTLTKIGNDYYTTGSSFNPTPVIYHSTDLVHWEAIAQPVPASWTAYGDAPAGGCWGGHIVYHDGKWWDFFGKSFTMYFVTADNPRGPWSMPTLMRSAPGVPGFGADNSIFIDDDGSWYLLVKNGQVNNWIVQLGGDGHPSGAILNLCWLNPAPSYPYSWAEGPVMWKYHGYYYYSFARDVSGGQKVMRSEYLTDDKSSWSTPVDFFNANDPLAYTSAFSGPNHSSGAVMLDDSTWWVLHPTWSKSNGNEWWGQGRQGLLNQVRYDSTGNAIADFPINAPRPAPKLPSSGIPWMVPHSDFFTSTTLNPEWSFMGYTPENTHSLTARPGWLTLSPRTGKYNTIVKTEGEHNYSVITRLDFDAKSVKDSAGIWAFNGLQTLAIQLCSTMDSTGKKVVAFTYNGSGGGSFTADNIAGNVLWLKMVRVNHVMSGFWSADGKSWNRVGSTLNVASMDGQQPNYNGWTGTHQGLFVKNNTAAFDLYVYRDSHTSILAECPANQSGTSRAVKSSTVTVLDNIHNNDWALYAGVEFGSADYPMENDSVRITASCASSGGGTVEVWLDSLGTGAKIAECPVTSTGSLNTFATFSAPLTSSVSGNHDVYLRFTGTGTGKLFQLQWLGFSDTTATGTSSIERLPSDGLPGRFSLEQNYPNPFNPATTIRFSIPTDSFVTLRLFDVAGKDVGTLISKDMHAGSYSVRWNAQNFPSGVYLYRLKAGNFTATKKTIVLK